MPQHTLRWQWALRLLTRRLWFRAALFCLFGVALALAGALIGHTISYDFATKIGSKSVDGILNVLASSMLAVTTFSLTAMVSAFSGATSSITPRAVQLLIDDSTAQNALATFLGSFLFAIVGIIALSTGIYGETGRVILYIGTVLVILVIVITFLRWIEHITRFGRVGDTIGRVERAAIAAIGTVPGPIAFGPSPSDGMPPGAFAVRDDRIGRVNHVDLEALAAVAGSATTVVHLAAPPGKLVDPTVVLAWTALPLDEEGCRRVRQAFTLADTRTYDHDPRFGLVVLGEIAARALSAAMNDPGTAIAVIEAGTRVLAALIRHEPDAASATPDGVVVPPIAFADALEDLYRPVARDGAATIEVALRLQKALAALVAIRPVARPAALAAAMSARDRGLAALASEDERAQLVTLFDERWAQG